MTRHPEPSLSAGNWALLATLMFGSTLVFLFICIRGVAGGPDRFVRFEAPGVQEIALSSAGSYLLYHEYDRTPDSQGKIRPDTVESMNVSVQSAESGEIVDVTPARGEPGYVLRRIVGEPVYRFEIPAAGLWRIATELQGGQEGTARLSVIPNPQGYAMRAFMRGFAFQVGAFVAIVLLAYYLRARGIKANEAEPGAAS